MSESQEKIRELVDLDVEEVSLVDHPAIEREFLVVKNLEDEPMADDASVPAEDLEKQEDEEEETEETPETSDGPPAEEAKADEVPDAAAEEAPEEEPEKQLAPDLAAAVETALPWLREQAEMAEGDLKGALSRLATFFEEEGAMEEEKSSPMIKAELVGNALSSLQALMGALEKSADDEPEVEKSEEEPVEDPIQKQLEGLEERLVAKIDSAFEEKIEAVEKRIETVEKTRGESRADHEEGTQVAKSKEKKVSFKGVLGNIGPGQ
jgi:hypothetical protein